MGHLDPMLGTMIFAIAAGIGVLIVARKIKVSAIALLLLVGVVLGPTMLGIVKPDSLGTNVLNTFVSLAVAIILFEGGLSLDYSGYKHDSWIIRLLLTVGVVITWMGVTFSVWLIFGYCFVFSMLAGSLVIVTGPTVIAPLLKRIRVKEELHQILMWEGVLIDPIGVFIAILCFEIVNMESAAHVAFSTLLLRFTVGISIGLIFGYFIYLMLKNKIIPDDQANIFALGVAIFIFGLCHILVPESGLLAVVIAGYILGIKKPKSLENIKRFELQLTEVLIGMLFILLAANLDFSNLGKFAIKGIILIGIILFIIRPLVIFVCTAGSKITFREKLFLSWIAPRGIIAASMATLFALKVSKLEMLCSKDAWFLETFTFSVIVVTVLFQGFSAGIVANFLGVKRPDPTDWLIVGITTLSKKLCSFITENSAVKCILIDTNPKDVEKAVTQGFNAVCANALEEDLNEKEGFLNIGRVFALTDNEELNALICDYWATIVGRKNTYRWTPGISEMPKNRMFAGNEVWSDLPKPTSLAMELKMGKANVFTSRFDKIYADGKITPLVAISDGEVIFPSISDKGIYLTLPVFALKRRNITLMDIISKELIYDSKSNIPEEFFHEALDRIADLYPQISKDDLYTDLINWSNLNLVGIGNAVAIPSCYCWDIETPLCAVIRLSDGINFHAFDEKSIRLIFLLLSPSKDPKQHIALQSDIAHLLSSKKIRESILSAQEGGEIFSIIKAMV